MFSGYMEGRAQPPSEFPAPPASAGTRQKRKEPTGASVTSGCPEVTAQSRVLPGAPLMSGQGFPDPQEAVSGSGSRS